MHFEEEKKNDNLITVTKKIGKTTQKKPKMGGLVGPRRWIKKVVNVNALILPTVDKGRVGGKALILQRLIFVFYY